MFEQLAFDLDAVAAAPGALSVGFGYTTEYRTVEEHMDSLDAWTREHGIMGRNARSRMWGGSYTAPVWDDVQGHSFVMLTADLRTPPSNWMGTPERAVEVYSERDPSWPDSLMYQTICERCGWHSIHECENDAVEAWHDHAMPGWRDLPVIPIDVVGKARSTWVKSRYPQAWQFEHAPTRSERGMHAGRHHASSDSNPWGGFDLAAPAVDRGEQLTL